MSTQNSISKPSRFEVVLYKFASIFVSKEGRPVYKHNHGIGNYPIAKPTVPLPEAAKDATTPPELSEAAKEAQKRIREAKAELARQKKAAQEKSDDDVK